MDNNQQTSAHIQDIQEVQEVRTPTCLSFVMAARAGMPLMAASVAPQLPLHAHAALQH
jgi:hypothetical protein